MTKVIRMDQEHFRRGFDDVLTLAPIRHAVMTMIGTLPARSKTVKERGNKGVTIGKGQGRTGDHSSGKK